jgi:hypothetical protein
VELASFTPLTFRLKAMVQYDSRHLEADVRAALEAALQAAFAFTIRGFGQPVTAAEIMAILHGVAGVIAVDLDELAYVIAPKSAAPRKTLGLVKTLQPRNVTADALLPAHTARRVDAKIQPAELLLLDAAGIDLSLVSMKTQENADDADRADLR